MPGRTGVVAAPPSSADVFRLSESSSSERLLPPKLDPAWRFGWLSVTLISCFALSSLS